MESLKESEKEMDLYKAVVNMAFNHEEVDRIVAKSRYDVDQRTWSVPEFMFRSTKQLQFVKEAGERERMLQEKNALVMQIPSSKASNSKTSIPTTM